jgi:A/G-specific adenine glycosylase
MTKRQAEQFQKTIYEYYRHNKRTFPWRNTHDPYLILVSEIMLQQTQTDRVVPRFESFVSTFPTIESLAQAPLKKVLQQWQGLGYNRRGLMLHKAAKETVAHYNSKLPKDKKLLESLPGIGPYTAGAVMAFAFNTPVVMIETNIRTVFIHHFFTNHGDVHDNELLPLIEQTLDVKNPRKWYSALMDYGNHLKKHHPNPNRKSKHYTKQSKFEGSDRQVRGLILRELTHKNMSMQKLYKKIQRNDLTFDRFEKIVHKLAKDSLVTVRGDVLSVL